jgi:hypothetical protein
MRSLLAVVMASPIGKPALYIFGAWFKNSPEQ